MDDAGGGEPPKDGDEIAKILKKASEITKKELMNKRKFAGSSTHLTVASNNET